MAEQDNPFRGFTLGEPRDPARIDQLLEQIRVIWHAHPDMRLLQLLICAVDHEPNRLFGTEDDLLAERLNELAETGKFPTAP